MSVEEFYKKHTTILKPLLEAALDSEFFLFLVKGCYVLGMTITLNHGEITLLLVAF